MLGEEELITEVILLHHDMLVERHGGQLKIIELVTRNFWWPGVTKEVKKYMKGCNLCQRNKNQTEVPVGKLIPNEAPTKP